VLIGEISSVAQWFGVTAYKFGEANVISNVEYTKMIYSLLLGYCFFSEVPDLISLTGAAIIVASVFLPYLLVKLTGWHRSILLTKRS
jgi:drug/metabolite transporter (DMT)-like permease